MSRGYSGGWVLALVGATSACAPRKDVDRVWQLVEDKLPGGLLRVVGTSSRDVYAVGADPRNEGSLVLHFDGDRWERLHTGTTGDLWWLEIVGPDDVRMVGEGGLVLVYHPATRTFERLTSPGVETLFGVFGLRSSDVWYVGGVPSARGVVWRDTGNGIQSIPNVPTPTVAALFKAHGFADGRLWVVGEGGLAALWDGTRFVRHPTGKSSTLFTVHGRSADDVYAVGGAGFGVILRWDGARWVDESRAESSALTAVFVSEDGERVLAAGANGLVLERGTDGAWTRLEGVPTLQDFHSIWIDERGGLWAVGGQLASDPPRSGMLVHYGEAIATGLSGGSNDRDASVAPDASGPDASSPASRDAGAADADSTDRGTADAGATSDVTVEVGTGASAFVPVTESDVLMPVRGAQGGDRIMGYHLWGAARVKGLDPSRVTLDVFVEDADTNERRGRTQRISELEAVDDAYVAYGLALRIDDCCRVENHRLRLRLVATDDHGTSGQDVRIVRGGMCLGPSDEPICR